VTANAETGGGILRTSPAADHLVVRIEGREFGIPMSSVREVSSAQVPTMVPGLPDYIRGVVWFGGRPTPVVDPARFMKGPLLELSARSCLLYIGDLESESVTALLIDGIVGVLDAAVAYDQKGRKKRSPLLAPAFILYEGKQVVVMHVQSLFSGQGSGGSARSAKGKSL
jgi:chemotaxis signal transduction protein